MAKRMEIPPTRTISRVTARRLAISQQNLAGGKQAAPPNAETVLNVVRDLGCLQLDPISAVARSHFLVMWSRVGVYDPALIDRLLFQDRHLFEYWAHQASIVLTEDHPIHAVRMRAYARDDSEWSRNVRDWVTENQALHDHILHRLRHEGAALSRQFEVEGLDTEHWVSSGWTSGRNVSRMLDYLWARGDIMVSGRIGGQKQWDLAERVLPTWVPQEPITVEEATRRSAVKAIRALGVAREQHIKLHYTRYRYHGLEVALEQLVGEGALQPLAVEGTPGTWYARSEDVALIDQIEAGDWAGRTTLLSPFDNLMCDRARTLMLFDFEYTMEIYVPAAKRRYGYYVLPILHQDRLIGRISPLFDRKTKTLTIHDVYAEADAPAEAWTDIRTAIESLGMFLGAATINFGNPLPSVWGMAPTPQRKPRPKKEVL